MTRTEITIDRFDWKDLDGTDLGIRYARFRGRVYVLERQFRDPDVLDLRGGETDEFDPHSVHFLASDGTSGEIIGCVRSIAVADGEFPLQHHFPGALERSGIDSQDCVEVSRFIADHESFRLRRTTSLLLIRSVVRDCIVRERSHTIFIVEELFARWLGRLGVPVELLDEFREIPEEHGVLAPIAVNAVVCDATLASLHRAYGRARKNAHHHLHFAEVSA
ncbi:MAG: GNAT family N-acetyltransferase [Acidimicrobiia bacterium]|nr:GNAT family N-acetyltransferase [Acidimicrobiia bacterium]